MDGRPLRIGQVSDLSGLSVDAIRFYERAGLLPKVARSASGYRQYSRRDLADLEFVHTAQQLGFSLHEIRELLSIQRSPHEACSHVRDLIDQKLVIVRKKIAELRRLENELHNALLQCRDALEHDQDCCPVLKKMAESSSKTERG
jgi:MerR family copper efflux transcriptional regulator